MLTQRIDSPLEAKRRRFFFWGAVAGFPGTLYGLWINSLAQLPAIAFIALALLLLATLLLRPTPMPYAERFAASSLAGYTLLMQLGMFLEPNVDAWTNTLHICYQLFFLTVTLLFLVFEGTWRVSGGFALVFTGIVLLRLTVPRAQPEGLLLLGGFLFIAVATLIILSVYGAYRQQLERERILSSTDPLTGALNRRPLLSALERMDSLGQAYAVVLIDLDHFKRVNDRFGHAAGDATLSEVARLIGGALERGEQFSRWGGEEFLLLLPGAALDHAVTRAETLRRQLEAHAFTHGEALTASFGVGESRVGESYRSVLNRADAAVYRAKAGGRNQVRAGGYGKPPEHHGALEG